MKIISFYTSLLIILFFILSVNTIRKRRKTKIAIGHDENPELLRAIRAHSNFSEYVPINLMALYLVESQGASPLFVHFLGTILVIGRLIHAYGISQVKENFRLRITGMSLTFTTMLLSAGYLIFTFFLKIS
jgi:uncharacterized membrane protein YecN with MAPEG domain